MKSSEDAAALLKALRINVQPSEHESSPRKLRRFGSWTLGTLLALLLISAVVAVTRTRLPLPTVVDVVRVEKRSSIANVPILKATGYVSARRSATVSAQVTGVLAQVLVEEGDAVVAGQIIARLDVKASTASVKTAGARLRTSLAQTEAFRVAYLLADSEFKRQEALAAVGMISNAAMERAKAEADKARANFDSQQTSTDEARARLDEEKVNRAFSEVRAPFAGIVTTRDAQVGEIVSPLSAGGSYTRTGIATIVDMKSLELDVNINESFISRLSPGMPAQVHLDAYPDWEVPSHVVAIVPTASRSGATVKVRVAFNLSDARILPNMAAKVTFLVGPLPKQQNSPILVVPTSATIEREGRTFVYVVEGKVVRETLIQARLAESPFSVVESGLFEGMQVVNNPKSSLVDGAAVKLATTSD